jgi:hypothetical protein
MNQYFQAKYEYWLKRFFEKGNRNFFARAQFYKMKRDEFDRIDNYFDRLGRLIEDEFNKQKLKEYEERGDDELNYTSATH